MTSEVSLVDYQYYVELLASTGENKIFFNSGSFHAAMVMSRIFKYARQRVRIYNGGFNGVVSNDADYLAYLTQFLNRKGRVEVLVEKDLKHAKSKVFEIFHSHSELVEIRLTNKRIVDETTDKPLHFTLGDENMYRIETNTETYSAQVNFGDETTAKKYHEVFDKLFAESAVL